MFNYWDVSDVVESLLPCDNMNCNMSSYLIGHMIWLADVYSLGL